MKKYFYLLWIVMSCTYAQNKVTSIVNMGIGNLKLNTVLTDSLILQNSIADFDNKSEGLKVYRIDNYVINSEGVNNLEVKTFKGFIFLISFNFTGATEKMMENKYGVSYEGSVRTNYKSQNINQKIYGSYKYNKIFFIDENLSSKILISFNCSNLVRKIDSFTNEISISTPLLKTMSLTKIINKKGTSYYLSIDIDDNFLSIKGDDFYILFQDGSKFYRKAKIDVDVNKSGGYRYSVFVSVLPIELQQFCKKKIEKIRLYIFDRDVINESESFLENANCISKAR